MNDQTKGINIIDDATRGNLIESLMQRKKQAAITGDGAATDHPVTSQAVISPSQSRLLFLTDFEGDNSVYNMPSLMEISGGLSIEALENSINVIIRRHAVFRTKFIKKDGEFYQEILPIINLNIDIINVDDKSAAMACAEKEAKISFDLSKAPLLRVKLYRLNSEKAFLFLNMHHIISDSWSLSVLLKEITVLYTSYIQNSEPQLPVLNKQFTEYSQEQNNSLTKAEYQGQLQYWLKQLHGKPELVSLPTDMLRPRNQSYNGDYHTFTINPKLSKQIETFCIETGVTVYSFLLTILNILLSRHIDSSDISIGSPIANRNNSYEEQLIGFFVNTLVMRNKFSDDMTFIDLVKLIYANTIAALKNRMIPFEYLVENIKPERSLSYSPLVQIEFVLQNTPTLNYNIPGLQITQLQLSITQAKYDLSLAITKNNDAFDCIFEYCTDLYESAKISLLAAQYLELIKSALADCQAKIVTLNILSAKEYSILIDNWSGNQASYNNDKSFLKLFSEQVTKHATKISVDDGTLQLSYSQLDCRSNVLANLLLEYGIKKSDRVALFLNRDTNYLVAMLSCLKIGAIFVPFKPDAQFERNQRMLTHSECACILTDELFTSTLNEMRINTGVITLDSINWENGASKPVAHISDMDDIAYMIYTSGSTGIPKGVLVKHRGMINHLRAKTTDLKIDESDSVAQIAVQTFDVSIWQYLAPLLVGAKTIVLEGDDAWVPTALLKSIDEFNISILETVPSHLELLINEIEINNQLYNLNQLRCVISNGEPLTTLLYQHCVDVLPDSLFVNAYGPSECSDDVTHNLIDKGKYDSFVTIPLGKPIANTKIYLLDKYLQPVPIGVAGELYVTGECVGEGYFNAAIKTRDSFIKNHISGLKYPRLYKTGDIARFHYDGSLEYIGRIDDQLKIRGIRVETGEIDYILSQHKDVESCLTLGLKDKQDNTQLVVYIKSNKRPAPSSSVFRKYCIESLPDYMVPSIFIILDNFPLLHNGKIDKKQLPAPHEFNKDLSAHYVAPSTETEKQLADIWARLLDSSKIGINEDFFQIGGHSLLAIELVNEINKTYDIELPLKTLFENSTIATLSKLICVQP